MVTVFCVIVNSVIFPFWFRKQSLGSGHHCLNLTYGMSHLGPNLVPPYLKTHNLPSVLTGTVLTSKYVVASLAYEPICHTFQTLSDLVGYST